MFVVEVNKVLQRSKKLSKDELVLRLGDGKAVAAEAVGIINLVVSDRVRLELKDCYFVPSMIKNIISIPLLDNAGFEFLINKHCFYLMKDGSSHLLGHRLRLLFPLIMFLFSIGEAMSDIDLGKWLQAMKSEMDSMSSNQVWTLVDRPKGVRPVACKWVYKCKIGADGEVTTFKAKLVMDVKIAFLNGFIEEEIYMDQPEGFTVVGEEQKCNKQISGVCWRSDWTAVKTILQYLRRTKDVFLVYGGGELMLEGFSDASFYSDDDDAKSQSGFVFKLNGGVVARKSSKQDTTTDSTMEAEYIADLEAAEETILMKNYIQELGLVPSIVELVVIFCDNNGAIAQAKEPRSHHQSKYILRRYHLLREMVGRGDVRKDRVSSAENTADPLIKPVSQIAHAQHLGKMCLRQMSDWL
ncbi:UNVERIFIED_CONTAM: Retrovirus-related Pol polyprotein from transposon RE2 [Sesamum calycinum]|uniref:Retrovirus-related Pol polyprotein from transposon RE2 n=1 Tax=Sesamum calycinum TaxID=2727403 RepID=A0AAW2IS71_9LAMI